MWLRLLPALALVLSAAAGKAEERPEGLLWNRSGLAATLPLQVKTSPGADYLLRLRDVETGRKVLAAYVRGGEFFRVLVPPGRYDLIFASGIDWQGEAKLFGPDTQHFVLDPALSFGAKVTRKEGHLVDLRNRESITIRDVAICQRLALDPKSLEHTNWLAGKRRARAEDVPRLPPQYPILRYDLWSQFCD
jgi:hypothetical protein